MQPQKRKSAIQHNLQRISQDLLQTGRPVQLVAVSKNYPWQDILYAYEWGQRDFGENRVQELLEKAVAAQAAGIVDLRWHFIGHLQKNKIKKLLQTPQLSYVHSIDSLALLQALCGQVEQQQMADLLSFFLQVKTSGEEEKSGFASGEECAQAAQWFLAQKAAGSLSQVDWVGLMTMGSIRGSDFQQDARAAFQQLQQLREQLLVQYRLPQLHLSMGMSQDYPLAIELGSDWVRIGSDIFSSAHSDI